MWQKDKRTVLIVLGTLLVLLIWNGYNISSWRGLSAEEEALRTEQEKVGARIHNPDEALSEDQVYIAWAIKKQAEYRKELEEELGAQFTSQVFSIPKAYLPRAGTTSMVFFDEKSGDEKVNLIKKSDVFGFRINTELRFGDADDQNLKECVSMLYLIQRVMNEAIENGLKSLETLRQKPVETLNSL